MSSLDIPWLAHDSPFPAPETALGADSGMAGLLAAGGNLSPQRLVLAYEQGIFPWFSKGQPILWWSTDPRMVLHVDEFKLHRSLKKTLKTFIHSPECEIRIDHDFSQVIRRCAGIKRSGQPGTWILPEMVLAYEALHQAGFAHSVETWIQGQMVGGLYCVALGGAVFGESMFALQPDASKIALSALVAFCRQHHIPMIDCQQNTRHLASLGAREIARSDFLGHLRKQRQRQAPTWDFKSIYWSQVLPTHPL
jgi:leucyl/phenylalanyl-tRNA--protein transferase